MSEECCFKCDNEFDSEVDEGRFIKGKYDDPSFEGEYMCRSCINKAHKEYESRLAAEEDHGQAKRRGEL